MPLEAQNLTVSYHGDIYVLTDVSIRAEDGRITCIIGPNGAGKSTFVKTVFGYLTPRRGRILLDDHNITRLSPFKRVVRGIGYVAQEHTVFPVMTVQENLELGAWTFRRNRREVRMALERIYARYPILKERRSVKAGNLSGGEQRMLEIGQMLMPDPQVLLFDEPTAGLAPRIASEVYREVEKLRDQGKTILLVDQNVRQAVPRSDYLYVLELGRIRSQGQVRQMEQSLRNLVASWLQG